MSIDTEEKHPWSPENFLRYATSDNTSFMRETVAFDSESPSLEVNGLPFLPDDGWYTSKILGGSRYSLKVLIWPVCDLM